MEYEVDVFYIQSATTDLRPEGSIINTAYQVWNSIKLDYVAYKSQHTYN
jgi:hypothetical protein